VYKQKTNNLMFESKANKIKENDCKFGI